MTQWNRRNWLKMTGSSLATLALPTSLELTTSPNGHYSADDFVRLMSNENPYGPSLKVKLAMQKAMDQSFQYPTSNYHVLVDRLAAHEGVDADHILLTSGSNEGLRVVAACYGSPNQEILTCAPTYKALLSYAQLFGGYVNNLALTDDLQFDLEALEKCVSNRTAMVFLCNPNNPTGALLDPALVRQFCEVISDRTLIFSDEAYYDYIEDDSYPSMVNLVRQGKNVIVSRTFSKVYGMAGVRVGYLIARPDMIKRLKPYVMSYVHMMGIYGATQALDDTEFYNYSLTKNRESKEIIYQTCKELGLQYVPSHTNFVFVHTGKDVRWLNEQMLNNGVRVGRPFPPLTQWSRVSTGTNDQMMKWSEALKKVL